MAKYHDRERQRREYLRDALKHPLARLRPVRQRVMDLPTCKKCGAVAFRHGAPDRVRCPKCGYEGPAGPPLKIRAREISVP